MKISIITVCFNSAATIEETVKSVLSQDFPELEYVVIDGGSSDDTMAILKKYSDRISHLISEKDNGIYDALNKGLGLVTGDVVGILHADDVYTNNNVLSSYARLFIENKCEAVYADLQYVDRSDLNKVVRTWKSGQYKPGMFLNGWMPPHPTFFVRKECYRSFGRFNTSFKTAADYELMLRFIHVHRIRLCYLPEFTVKMRAGGVSNVSLKNRINANLEDRRAWEINQIQPRFYTLWLKPLRKLFQFV